MRVRRGLGAVMALGLLIGGAAACSDDDDGGDGGGDTPTTTTAAPGDDGTGDDGAGDQPTTTAEVEVVAANDAVIQEYCDAAEAYADALEAGDPGPLEEASARLGEASDAVGAKVADFTPEQSVQFEECSEAAAGG